MGENMNRHKVPKYRSPVTVLKGYLVYYQAEGNRRAVEEYELAIEVLTAVGIQ